MVGGLGVSIHRPFDKKFMDKIIKELKAKNSMPDFLSYYLWHISISLDSVEKEQPNLNVLFFEKNEINNKISELKVHSAAAYSPGNDESESAYKKPPLYITEWNIDYTCKNLIHDSLFKAPFIIKSAIDTMDSIDALAYWLASDISAEYIDSEAPLFGGPGLISRNGIRKPAFYAYQFLSKLGGQLLVKGDGYIICAIAEDEYVAIIYNYKYINKHLRFLEQLSYASGSLDDYLEDTKECSFNVEIKNRNPGRYKIRQHILNSSHGSVYDTWIGLSAIQNLSISEAKWLEQTCFPHLIINYLTAKDSLNIHCELKANEVRLLEISRVFE